MIKYKASNNYVIRQADHQTIYIASETRDAVKIAELMNELDKATGGKWTHQTERELRSGIKNG